MSNPSRPLDYRALLQDAVLEVRQMRARLDAVERERTEPIAITGMSCRFPGGAVDPEAFWRLLREGVDAITEIPKDRWSADQYYDADVNAPGKMNCRWGGFLEQVDGFDPYFFNLSPREAATIDPQQRLFLEVACEALEDAGERLDRLVGGPVGVFGGAYNADYGRQSCTRIERIDGYTATGSINSFISGRASYLLDFKGPSVAVDTACSSSLVAVHLACQSLRNKECRIALAGGVNLILSPSSTIMVSKLQALSTDGRCKAFDARANGFVRSEGCAVVTLKRLSDALADGDAILALIRSSVVNQDGRSAWMTAPNMLAQRALLQEALARAGVTPAEIGYVEAHGTGTPLGDPIELEALKEVLGHPRSAGQRCLVGSVKTNLGHLEATAGVAGLMKVVLAMQHEQIPPHLHFKRLNPRIRLDDTPLTIPTELCPWPAGAARRYAGVSSFGLSGTNAHVIVEEAPLPKEPHEAPRAPSGLPQMVPLSARSPAALSELAHAYRAALAIGRLAATPLEDISYSAGVRRGHYEHRMAVVAASREELAERLEAAVRGEALPGVAIGPGAPDRPRKVVFVFPGQGSQWVGMGRELLQSEPVFRQSMEQCDAAMRPYVGWSLLGTLTGGEAGAPLDAIDVIQPALFAMQVSLAALWRSWGVQCDAVVGHSMGEIAAAHVAGALSLADAAKIICQRSLLLRRMSGKGAMAVVELSLEQAKEAIAGFAARVSIGVSNSARSTVLSGDRGALEEIIDPLEKRGVFCRWVKVDIASHSPQMAPLLPDLMKVLAGIEPRAASLPIYSTVTGAPTDGAGFDAAYWARNLREPVLFATAVKKLLTSDHDVFIELSPHPILLPPLEEGFRHEGRGGRALPSLRSESPERATMLASLGALYTLGYPVDFARLHPRGGKFVRLPTYPWQRERFPLELETSKALGSLQASSLPAGTGSRHPLLGAHCQPSVAAPGTHVWEMGLGASTPPWLQDHRVQGKAVLPATAYLEIALASAAEAFGPGPHALEDVSFARALFLPEQGHVTVQALASAEGPALGSFQILSLTSEGDNAEPSSWALHASGRILLGSEAPAAEVARASLDEIKARCSERLSGAEHYQAMKAQGLEYGPAFQGIDQLFRGDGEALGRLRPDVASLSTAPYEVHPALLDSCFQILAAALGEKDASFSEGSTYLPVALDALRIIGQPREGAYCHARLDATSEVERGIFEGQLALFDEEGRPVLEARGLRVQRVGQETAQPSSAVLRDWLYEIAWRRKDAAPLAASPPSPSGRWLVFADSHGVGRALSDLLETRGERCTLVFPDRGKGQSPGAASHEAGERHLAPARAEDFNRLLSEVCEGEPPCRGIVYLWALDAPSEPLHLEDLSASEELTSTAVVHLIQAIGRAGFRDAPQLWLVTRGAQAVTAETTPVSIAQSPLWGLGATVVYEHPELHCTCVDLAPEPTPGVLGALMNELAFGGDEERIALRPEGRYVGRLARYAPGARPEDSAPIATAPAGYRPFHLELTRPGRLDSLELRATHRTPPGRGEVEIQVRAAGLNFLDVLLALGVIPAPASTPTRSAIRLGNECAGTIIAVGEGVESLRVGQDVVAIAEGSIGAFVTTKSALATPKPARLSFEAAATIPVAFLTAFYALHHVGRMAPGERVLIHAAAGGVGLSAVQVAQRAGAEVFATAGSPEKREMLRALGVKHVADSRSLSFVDEIRAQTGGAGVDIVLNSLSGPFIPASLDLLRDHGRFIEIGKRDYLEDRKIGLRPFLKNLSYSLVDLRAMSSQRPEAVGALLGEVMQRFEYGELEPIAYRAHPIAEVTSALHRMAKAEHIGKLVVSLEGKEATPIAPLSGAPASLRADATYLITGGLGGLGLALARWLVEQGARHLVLVGRSGPSALAREAISALERAGAEVRVEPADVAKEEQLREVFRRIDHAMPPLAGIFHGAAVLEDATLLRQSPERFRAVSAPKIDGAWNLHALSQGRPLDLFVLYSSAASMLGSPGQANYAAANAFLDALAHHRRRLGLAGLSINWGAWNDVGLAAEKGDRGDRLATRGLGGMAPEAALAALGEVLKGAPAQIAVMPFDLRQWSQFHPRAAASPLFAELATELGRANRKSGTGELREALQGAPLGERLPTLEAHLREQLAQVLRVPLSRLERRTPLKSLGLDSLMAIEFRNRLEASLGLTLPATLVWGYPTIAELAPELGQRMQLPLSAEEEPAPAESAVSAPVQGEVETLASDALMAALADELAEIEREKGH